MKRRLLDLIVCPRCRGTFGVEPFREEAVPGWAPARVACQSVCGLRGTAVSEADSAAECGRCYASDVVEGALRCAGCGAAYPIIGGVPRLLEPPLLARMWPRYPDFFARHPEFVTAVNGGETPLAETLESFTLQRLDLGPPGPRFAHQWADNLRRNLGTALAPEALRGALVLDVGCGFGRHLYVASEAGAEVVGCDLSGGVDVARDNNRGHPRCHVVQADLYARPFREQRFDVVWSFGVLHHLPDPRVGFAALAPFAKRDGGVVVIWVYGYRGMAFTYRLSHMRTLHAVVHRLSPRARVRASSVVAAVLSALYWEPLRLAAGLGLGRVVGRLPLSAYVEHGWRARIAAVHDRLATPITHFHERDELVDWFRSVGLADVVVEDTSRRGWRAHGRRRAAMALAASA